MFLIQVTRISCSVGVFSREVPLDTFHLRLIVQTPDLVKSLEAWQSRFPYDQEKIAGQWELPE